MGMSDKEIKGGQPGSPAATERIKNNELAKKALKEADAAELFALYEKTVKESDQTLETLGMVVTHYAGDKNNPRFIPHTDAIEAMRMVSLAAIDLARAIALKEQE